MPTARYVVVLAMSAAGAEAQANAVTLLLNGGKVRGGLG